MGSITSKTKLCVIIGDPVEHSLSPQMHNAGYTALGIEREFVFVAVHVKKENVKTVAEAVRAMGIRGLTCTIPHKEEVMKHIDEVAEDAKAIGAANTVVNDKGALKGYNTDWLGVVGPLEDTTSLRGKKAVILGAGGAAKAAAFGLANKGAIITIVNEDLEQAKALAEQYGGKARSLEEIEAASQADIIFNATPVGMAPSYEEETLVPKEYIRESHIVFDAVYAPLETRLLREAKEQGATAINGLEMLLRQGTAQFEYYTGKEAPIEAMRKALQEHV